MSDYTIDKFTYGGNTYHIDKGNGLYIQSYSDEINCVDAVDDTVILANTDFDPTLFRGILLNFNLLNEDDVLYSDSYTCLSEDGSMGYSKTIQWIYVTPNTSTPVYTLVFTMFCNYSNSEITCNIIDPFIISHSNPNVINRLDSSNFPNITMHYTLNALLQSE